MIRRSSLDIVVPALLPPPPQPRDCYDIQKAYPPAMSGVYTVYYVNGITYGDVYCEMSAHGGGWTSFIRHYDTSVDFQRNWTEYRNGFGDPQGNYYYGNEGMRLIGYYGNSQGNRYRLAVVMEDQFGEKRTSFYKDFRMYSESSHQYRARFLDYESGRVETGGDSLSAHDNVQFSTYDQPNEGSYCASTMPEAGGFWNKPYMTGVTERWEYGHDFCHLASPNGIPGNHERGKGINWWTWKGQYESLSAMVWMVHPRCKSLAI